MGLLKDYLWPNPPASICEESVDALQKDLKESKGLDLSDEYRNRVSPWLRMKDRDARAINREWLKQHAMTFAKRWFFVSLILWLLAYLAEGILILEIPFTLSAYASGIVCAGFIYADRRLIRDEN